MFIYGLQYIDFYSGILYASTQMCYGVIYSFQHKL